MLGQQRGCFVPTPWISANVVLKRLANFLGKKDPSELAAGYLEDAQQAAVLACDEIRTIFRRHGWASSAIEDWDGRVHYSTMLATYHAATLAVGLGDYPLENLKLLDCREWLDTFAELSVAGEPVAPDADSVIGGIGNGRLTAADTSRCADDIRRVFG